MALPWQPTPTPAHAVAPVPITAPAREIPPGSCAVVILSYAVFKSTKTASAVVASGFPGMYAVPLSVGGLGLQTPRPAEPVPPGTAARLQVRVLISATFPLMIGLTAPVVDIPARDALPNDEAIPRFTGPPKAGGGATVVKFHAKIHESGTPPALVTAP